MNQAVESALVAANRKEIYIGEVLRRLLVGRKESLSTVVNVAADRYLGLLERQPKFSCTAREEDVYRAVLGETRGRLLEAREIATFPQAVADWLNRNPEYPPSAYERVRSASFVELLALIDRLERAS